MWGYSVPRMLGVHGRPLVSGERKIVPLEAHGGVKAISIEFFLSERDQAITWRGPMLHKAIRQFLEDVDWGELDYLLIDLPPGTGDVSMTLAQLLPQARFLIVTTPQPAAQSVAKRAAETALRFELEILGVVENMSGFTTPGGERLTIFGEGGGQLLADELEVPLLGKVPLQEELRVGRRRGPPPRARRSRRAGVPVAVPPGARGHSRHAAGASGVPGARGPPGARGDRHRLADAPVRVALGAILVTLAAAPGAGAAELFYGVTESNRLVSFASDSPGSIRSSVPISGTLESENILAIDIRPANGRLYGLGSANLLYVIDGGSGVARPVGPLFDVPIRGSSYGFDFNPTADRVRVVSDAELNMRLNPDDGRVVDRLPSSPTIQPDVDLSYADGDPAAGGEENVSAIAYTTGAMTQVFGLDTERDTLVRLDPPNEGVLHTVGPLGTDAGDPNGFEISAAGTAYAVFKRAGRPLQDLMSVDLATGQALAQGKFSGIGTFVGGRPDPIRALTAAGAVADDLTRPGLVFTPVRTPSLRGLLRRRPLVLLASCSEACRVDARLVSRHYTVTRAVRFVRERAGVVRMKLVLSRKDRRYVRRNAAHATAPRGQRPRRRRQRDPHALAAPLVRR